MDENSTFSVDYKVLKVDLDKETEFNKDLTHAQYLDKIETAVIDGGRTKIKKEFDLHVKVVGRLRNYTNAQGELVDWDGDWTELNGRITFAIF